MSAIHKLSGLVTLGSTFVGLSLFPRFLRDVVAMLVFTILGSMLGGALVLGGLYGLYIVLTQHGLEAQIAALVSGGLAFLITLLFVGLAVSRARKLLRAPQQFLRRGQQTVVSNVVDLAEAFLDGLCEDRPTKPL